MIQKNILRQEIKKMLRRYMEEGSVRPGERLSLPQIAKDLDVSVTPVREALSQLTETGIVHYQANRGFFVTELQEQEALELYEIIILLESEALLQSTFEAGQIASLRSLNKKFLQAKSPKEKLRLDKAFHQKLIENYPNQLAHKIIEDIRIRIIIYELEYMSALPAEASSDLHENLITHLENKNIEAAIQDLRANWQLSTQNIIS